MLKNKIWNKFKKIHKKELEQFRNLTKIKIPSTPKKIKETNNKDTKFTFENKKRKLTINITFTNLTPLEKQKAKEIRFEIIKEEKLSPKITISYEIIYYYYNNIWHFEYKNLYIDTPI